MVAEDGRNELWYDVVSVCTVQIFTLARALSHSLYHFIYEKGSLSLLNAVKSEITVLAKFWFSLECFLELNTFCINKGFVDAILIGPSGPMKWYAIRYFTLKTLNTNSQGKVARQIFGNLPCRSPLKNWNIFFHDIMNEGRQWPWFQLCNHLWMSLGNSNLGNKDF